MNKDLGTSSDSLTEKSTELDINNTKEVGIQVGETNKVKAGSIGKEVVGTEQLIDLNTAEGFQYSQDFDRVKYLEAIKNKDFLNKTLSPARTTNKVEYKRSGSRSDPSVEHVQLEPVTRRRTTKVLKESKMDVDKWTSVIPVCVGAKNVSEFINTCEIAIQDVASADQPLLLKIINSKLSGNALEACKYRETDSWDSIKTILQGAFEHRASERALTIGLNCARMMEGEGVAKFASRIEEMYYKLCAASTEKLPENEAKVIKRQHKKQALIVFINGLPEHLNLVLKARDPQTLEAAMQIARDEELEYDSKVKIAKLQDKVELQNFNKEETNVAGGNNIKRQNYGYNNFNKNQGVNNQNGGNNSNYRQNNNRYNNFNRNQGFNNQNGGNNNNYHQNSNGFNNFNKNPNRNGYSGYGRQNLNTNNQNAISRNNTGCYICGRTNHFARECRQVGQNQNQIVNRQPTMNNNNTRNNNSHARNNNNVNNSGSPLHCSYCNKIGHEITNCFTKQRNEQSNSNKSGNANVRNPSGVRFVHEIMNSETPQDDVYMSLQ